MDQLATDRAARPGSAAREPDGLAGGAHAAGDVAQTLDVARRLRAAVASVIEGKDEAIATTVAVFLAGGHVLLQDVPGVGKTTLAKALSRAVDCPMRRIQFTPDLLPSDITGITVYDRTHGRFDFRPGAIFANIVVCDEINRATPKTQSAVLESMEEAQVTVDGHTYPLDPPFFVIATQNPLEMEGTYPLPEAQRDRFTARVSLGYPDPEAELAMLDRHGSRDPLAELAPVTDAATVARTVAAVRRIHASPALKRYVVALVGATRDSDMLRLGASPRASLHLLRAAQGAAALDGRDHVLPEDVRALFAPVLAHRVLPSAQARLDRVDTTDVLAELLRQVPVPSRPRA